MIYLIFLFKLYSQNDFKKYKKEKLFFSNEDKIDYFKIKINQLKI